MSDTPAIDISDVWFSYGGPPVLRDVTLRVAPRDRARAGAVPPAVVFRGEDDVARDRARVDVDAVP